MDVGECEVKEVIALLRYDLINKVLELEVLEINLVCILRFLLWVSQVLKTRLTAPEILAVQKSKLGVAMNDYLVVFVFVAIVLWIDAQEIVLGKLLSAQPLSYKVLLADLFYRLSLLKTSLIGPAREEFLYKASLLQIEFLKQQQFLIDLTRISMFRHKWTSRYFCFATCLLTILLIPDPELIHQKALNLIIDVDCLRLREHLFIEL